MSVLCDSLGQSKFSASPTLWFDRVKRIQRQESHQRLTAVMPSHSQAPRLLVRLQKASCSPLSIEGSYMYRHQDRHKSNNYPAAASDSANFTVRKHVAIALLSLQRPLAFCTLAKC